MSLLPQWADLDIRDRTRIHEIRAVLHHRARGLDRTNDDLVRFVIDDWLRIKRQGDMFNDGGKT